MINYSALSSAPVATEPFPYLAASNVIGEVEMERISSDFPAINDAGVFALSDLEYGQAFADLIDDVRSTQLQSILEEKFALKLSDKPLMITVRGRCQKKDGRIHTDSKDKVLTCLLYLNDNTWNADGGRLRLLRNGKDLDSTIAEIPPNGGNFVSFVRTDNSWHGHAPFEGPRRYIMFNWLRSDVALAKNLGRHKLSAVFKRLGMNDAY